MGVQRRACSTPQTKASLAAATGHYQNLMQSALHMPDEGKPADPSGGSNSSHVARRIAKVAPCSAQPRWACDALVLMLTVAYIDLRRLTHTATKSCAATALGRLCSTAASQEWHVATGLEHD